jgi:DNA-binding protein YbaB
MTTENNSQNTSTVSDNKAVFGPLGKSAVIAVIMVSIIVTTAIMLDRQLNSVDEQIAAIKNEVAELNTQDTNTTDTITSTQQTDDKTPSVSIDEATVEPQSAETPSADVLIAIETTPEKVDSGINHSAQQSQTATAAQFELATPETSTQARIESYKQEHKQHMADMFARIKALESKQLNRYKASQDNQIVRLREQITQQQQMIETLVSRNKNLFELRSANVQRNQANREQILNRI